MPQELDVQRLPIVIAITGHRDLRPEDEPVLSQAIDAIFVDLQRRYPATPLLLLTPLAEGADQLAAEVARRRSIAYRVPMPMPLSTYREDFAMPDRLARFDELLLGADGPPYAMPFFESNTAGNLGDPLRRAHQYAVLAAHLSQAAHILIALWDGVPAQTIGGTAQAVRFRVLGVPVRYRARNVVDAPETGPVYHIYAQRRAAPPPAHPCGYRTLRVRRARAGAPAAVNSLAEQFAQIDEVAAGTPDPFAPLYARIDTFNSDCALVPRPHPEAGDSVARSLMRVTEHVATYYQRKFVRALQTIVFATAGSVLVFLLYADVVPQLHPIVVLYLATVCLAVFTYFAARRGRWQDRAQDYRALEVGLQVQQTWDAAGLSASVADYYIRRQRSELDWIRDAIRTVHIVDRPHFLDDDQAVNSVRDFVQGQYGYFAGRAGHPGGAARERRKARLHQRINRIALRASFGFSILLIIYGITAWLAPRSVAGLADESRWHGILMFAIGTTAAAAALFNEYSARRAHAQQARRYELMAATYRRALDALDEAGQRSAWRDPEDGPLPSLLETARACVFDLGREALSENTDWLLMHRELPLQLISVR